MPIPAWAGIALGAATGLVGTHKQASAAKDAAKQQVAGANQAKAELAPIHQANVARLQPYANIGTQALGSLGSLMGYAPMPGASASAPPTGYNSAGQPLGPMDGTQGPMNLSDPRVQHLARGGSMVDPEYTGQSRQTLASLGGQSSYGPQNVGKMVRLQAPTGEVRELPESQAMFFERQGARRVS